MSFPIKRFFRNLLKVTSGTKLSQIAQIRKSNPRSERRNLSSMTKPKIGALLGLLVY